MSNKDLRNETQITHPQSTHPRGRRLSRLPPLLHPRILRHRALRPPEGNDDLRRRVLHLLDNHHHRPRPDRLRPRPLFPIRRRRRDLLLRLLRFLRHGRPRRSLALPDGDQCPRFADQGGEPGDGDELDHELYGGGGDAFRDCESGVEILDHLGGYLCEFCADYVFLLSRDGGEEFGGLSILYFNSPPLIGGAGCWELV